MGPIVPEPTFTYPDSNPRNPTPHEGDPQIREAISRDQAKRKAEEAALAETVEAHKEKQWRLRCSDVERALGEFLGYEMYPNQEVRFRGIYGGGEGSSSWCFDIFVGKFVFRLTRTNGCPVEVGQGTKKGIYTVEVNTHFLLRYEPKEATWHRIKRLAEITDLQAKGELKTS